MSSKIAKPKVANPVGHAAPDGAAFDALCPLILARAREQSAKWNRDVPVSNRLTHVRKLRHLIAENADRLVAALGRDPAAESLSSEIIPLADACKFLEKSAEKILKPRRLRRSGRPFWLRGVTGTIRRVPLGAILILGPSNYPLFLPGVQALQALVAGNAVIIKPGNGSAEVAELFAELVKKAGFPDGLIQTVPESDRFGAAFAAAGFDKVILTGSAETGREVLSSLAPNLTPATVELSGCDAAFLTAQADVTRAATAIAFGLTLNQGKTCIAPRRIFVPHTLAAEFTGILTALLRDHPPIPVGPKSWETTKNTIDSALRDGAKFATGGMVAPTDPDPSSHSIKPTILTGVKPEMEIAKSDIFAPVASIIAVSGAEEALLADSHCPYALGASIFSGGADDPEARLLADRIRAGSVVINDIIVPTADPRIPFGGTGESGFGVTRGPEGLLELTRTKVIVRRRGNWLPHLDPPRDGDAQILSDYLRATHGKKIGNRVRAMRSIVNAAWKDRKKDDHSH